MKAVYKNYKILSFMLALVMIIPFMFSINAYAAGTTTEEAYTNLKKCIKNGQANVDITDNNQRKEQYKKTGGGYLLYSELVTSHSSDQEFFDQANFETLTAGAKQEFLKDIIGIANTCTAEGYKGITEETVNDMLEVVQSKSGMGSQLLATLMSETKPDYATANRMYKPFSGVVGTILALLSIIIMSLLGVTMALDLCYITIPAFQLIMGAEKDGAGQGGGATKFAAKLISTEAQKAVRVSQDVGQNGELKAAVGVYFKYRWKGLVILGICLLYLVQGQIYSFVAWVIDLLSGFIGF